jgi:ABC-type sugar transport system permease subunit
MAVATSEVKVRPKARKRDRPPGSAKRSVAIGFLLPAAVFLGALVVYPLVDTIAQSFQDPATRTSSALTITRPPWAATRLSRPCETRSFGWRSSPQ